MGIQHRRWFLLQQFAVALIIGALVCGVTWPLFGSDFALTAASISVLAVLGLREAAHRNYFSASWVRMTAVLGGKLSWLSLEWARRGAGAHGKEHARRDDSV